MVGGVKETKEVGHVTGEAFFFFYPPLCLYHLCCL